MDLNIQIARDRFLEFLPGDRGLVMKTEHDILTRMDNLIVDYDGPKVQSFHDKLDNVLIRFGWKLLEERLDISPERIYIVFERDSLADPGVQGDRLIEEREAKKTKNVGLRDIDI